MKKITLVLAISIFTCTSMYGQTDTSLRNRTNNGSWKSTDPSRDNGTMNRKDMNNPTPNTNTNTNQGAPNNDNTHRTPNNSNNGTLDNNMNNNMNNNGGISNTNSK